MSNRFTRGNESFNNDLTSFWQDFTFEKSVNKLRAYCVGNTVDNPVMEIKINDSDSFCLGIAHDLRLDQHIVNKVSYRRVIGTNGKVSLFGTRFEEV